MPNKTHEICPYQHSFHPIAAYTLVHQIKILQDKKSHKPPKN